MTAIDFEGAIPAERPAIAPTGVRVVTDRAAWDATVWSNRNGNILTSWMWGEYKARLGFEVGRIEICDKGGDLLAQAQYHRKKRFGLVATTLVQGGPLLTAKGERQSETVMTQLLSHLAPGPFDLVAIDYARFGSPAAITGLLAKQFIPVVARGNHTLDVDLSEGYEAVLKAADQRWRKDLRSAERADGLTVHFPTGPAERLAAYDAFSTMYDALKKRKGFNNNFDCASYRDLVVADAHHIFLEVRERGEIILVRIAHVAGERCTDFFTASNDRASTNHASTLAVSRLIEHAVGKGCKTFDFGGIDPAANPGVYTFKRKLTRNAAQTGPLWLWSRSSLLARAAAAFLVAR